MDDEDVFELDSDEKVKSSHLIQPIGIGESNSDQDGKWEIVLSKRSRRSVRNVNRRKVKEQKRKIRKQDHVVDQKRIEQERNEKKSVCEEMGDKKQKQKNTRDDTKTYANIVVGWESKSSSFFAAQEKLNNDRLEKLKKGSKIKKKKRPNPALIKRKEIEKKI